ncbi:MAG: hypothetical protein AB8E15_00070 [Bdellovibrionales bacterium]
MKKLILRPLLLILLSTPLSLTAAQGNNGTCSANYSTGESFTEKALGFFSGSSKKHLPQKLDDFLTQFQTLNAHLDKNSYFLQILKNAGSGKQNFKMTKSSLEKLLEQNDTTNENFIRRALSENTHISMLENARLKLMNDNLHQRSATAISNFVINHVLVQMVIQAHNSLYHKSTTHWDRFKQSWMASPKNESANTYSSYKASFQSLEPGIATKNQYEAMFNKAVKIGVKNAEIDLRTNYPKLMLAFDLTSPKELIFSDYFTGISGSDLVIMSGLQKFVRELERPKNKKGEYVARVYRSNPSGKLYKHAEKRYQEFYRIQNEVMAYFHGSRLVERDPNSGLWIPSMELLSIIKEYGNAPRNPKDGQQNTPRDNQSYYMNLQKLFEYHADVKLSVQQIVNLVDYYHRAKVIVPQFLPPTKPKPLSIGSTEMVLRFDKVGGSLSEMINVVYSLLRVEGKSLELPSLIREAQKGVDKTTEEMNLWAKEIERVLRDNFGTIEWKFRKSGDDFEAVASRSFDNRPEYRELETFSRILQENSVMGSGQSRVSIIKRAGKDPVEDRINIMEELAKSITRTYMNHRSSIDGPLPKFWTNKSDGNRTQIIIIEKISEWQRLIFEEAIIEFKNNNKSKDLDIEIKEPQDYIMGSLPLPFSNTTKVA